MSDREGGQAVLRATRALLRATSRAETAQVLHRVIHELAGEVVPSPGDESIDSQLQAHDVSLGLGERATVRAGTTADSLLGRYLPGLLEDATLVADRADEATRAETHAALDPLTRVVSQGHIARRLEATRSGAVVCVLDLDGFKGINDRMGHPAGDATLRRFGRHLHASTRREDFVARAGGDEFLVILDGDLGLCDAFRRMCELAATWAESELQTSTVSIGIAAVAGAGPILAAVAADRAMYRAKRGDVAVEIAAEEDADTSSGALANETYDAYLAGLSAADASAAVDALVSGAHRGMSEGDLVGGIIARAQSAVGDSWACGDWGIAEEHAATGVAEQALTMIAPPTPPTPGARRVVMACATGEGHTLPARLAARLARSPELDIIVLGGSMPAADLGASLRRLSPDVLGLSVTVATNLIGAYRCVQAARAEGVRVIVGGAAWGVTQHRAERLGASLMLTDPTDLARHVREGVLPTDTRATAPLDDEAILLEEPPQALMETALGRWASRQRVDPPPARRQGAGVALDWVARHAGAAVACDDPSVVGDLLESQIQSTQGTGVEVDAIVDVYLALADALAVPAPTAAAILRGQTRQLTRQHLVAVV